MPCRASGVHGRRARAIMCRRARACTVHKIVCTGCKRFAHVPVTFGVPGAVLIWMAAQTTLPPLSEG